MCGVGDSQPSAKMPRLSVAEALIDSQFELPLGVKPSASSNTLPVDVVKLAKSVSELVENQKAQQQQQQRQRMVELCFSMISNLQPPVQLAPAPVEPQLSQLPFQREAVDVTIAAASVDVLRMLSGVKCGPHTTLMNIDVKEFFLSVSHQSLVQAIASAFTGPLRRVVADILWLLLTSQYLKDFVQDSDIVWTTIRDSGMGARHSPHVSKFAFDQTVEKILLCSLKFYGVLRYIRDVDDVLVVAASPTRARALVRHFMTCCGQEYTLDLDDLSHVKVNFLDVTIRRVIHAICTCLGHRPYVKPIARHLPLHCCSMHPMTVHRFWPLSEVKHMHKRSMDISDFRGYRDLKLSLGPNSSCRNLLWLS